MHRTHRRERATTRSRMRWIPLAGVLAALTFSATAQAAGPQIVSTGSGHALQAESNFSVTVRPSNAANFRQRWQVEPAANGLVRYRNSALGSCLVTPVGATASSVNPVALGPCFGIGARNLWSSLSFSTSGRLLKSAQTGQLVAAPLCIDASPCDNLARVVPASFSPALDFVLRWRQA